MPTNRSRDLSCEDIKQMYFQTPKSKRSIRKLHSELLIKFKNKKKVPSLATIFRHMKAEDWVTQCESVDLKSNQIATEKTIEKKSEDLTLMAEKLSQNANKALEQVNKALDGGIGNNIEKVQDLLNMTKVGVESLKLSSLLQGNPTSISGHVSVDTSDVAKLKEHIAELYNSINLDLTNQQTEDKKLN